MAAIAESVNVENRRPPLRKLIRIINQRTRWLLQLDLRLSQEQNPGPNERFQQLRFKKKGEDVDLFNEQAKRDTPSRQPDRPSHLHG